MSQLSPARFTACLPHWLGGAIAVSTVIGLGTAPATAQIMPDSTLGTESSVVNPGGIVPGGPGILIEGGAARGGNLFHSFNEFNVNNGQRVYFADPAAIENILTRVTGENGSFIDGVLGVDGLANLYFLNPNGVIFGPNAQLDIPGSFVTSTGNSFSFADGSEFSALPTAGEALTVSVPLGVQFNDQAQGEIKQGGSLAVGAGKSLTLFGETVTVQGELTAPG
ncbi:MAG: filamentous hemagglutinin N-terminal domain-containing protein, partial [Cyanobacteria bacterium P01_F01_bin.4]